MGVAEGEATWGTERGGRKVGRDLRAYGQFTPIRAVHQLSKGHRTPIDTWDGDNPSRIQFRSHATRRQREWSRHGKARPRTYTGFWAWRGSEDFWLIAVCEDEAAVGILRVRDLPNKSFRPICRGRERRGRSKFETRMRKIKRGRPTLCPFPLDTGGADPQRYQGAARRGERQWKAKSWNAFC